MMLLWWSIVTATTVGYGDISPSTGLGRLIALILMATGIGLLGMITGSIATYFIKPETELPESVKFIKSELDRYEELNKEDLELLKVMINELQNNKQDT